MNVWNGRTLRPAAWAMLLCITLLASACRTCPITGRKVFAPLPESQMNSMGLDAYKQTLGESKVMASGADVEMIQRVGERIAIVVDAQMKEDGREPFEWEFNVIESEQVNAWALPGGKVAFYTGILPLCQNEAGVAVVMGHEVAHAYAHHGNKRMSEGAVAQFGIAAVQIALAGGEAEGAAEGAAAADADAGAVRNVALQALGVGTQLGLLAFGRGDESHADELGLVFMARSGYDPREAVAFWTRMQDASGGEAPPEFMSTHPSHDTRIADLEAQMPQALEIYDKAKSQ